jgi:hypothetical protein
MRQSTMRMTQSSQAQLPIVKRATSAKPSHANMQYWSSLWLLLLLLAAAAAAAAAAAVGVLLARCPPPINAKQPILI